jgi:UDPglucose 6-dehydrogenase
MKLAMIGAGYVGLVSGTGFAQFGNEVVCADTDATKISQLNRIKSPIYEPGLDDLLASNMGEGRLSFTTDVHQSIVQADVVFITVGTPQASDGSADLSSVMATARTIGEVLRETKQPHKVVVVKSTVPVGTTHAVGKIISSYFDKHCCVASNPEFLREGTAVEDFMRPDRVVIGTTCAGARDALMRLYRPMASGKTLVMDPASSELVKYASNAFLATRISYINELARLATALGADIDFVRRGMGADPRIGHQYLYPGPGYGGSCLPKDVMALRHMAEMVGQDLLVVNAANNANNVQRHLLGQLVSKFYGNLHGKKICVWGAAFKAETDDIRESPAVDFIDDMLAAGADVIVHDPQALQRVHERYGNRVSIASEMYESVLGADAIVLCTEWRQYRNPDVQHLKRLSRDLVAFDGRNVWDERDFDAAGVKLFGIVRKYQPESEAALHAVEDNLDPIGVLDTPNGVVSSRRPTPLQNHAVNETGSSLRALAK